MPAGVLMHRTPDWTKIVLGLKKQKVKLLSKQCMDSWTHTVSPHKSI